MTEVAGEMNERMVVGNPVYDNELSISPWEMDSAFFTRSDDPGAIAGTLEVIKKDHTMLVLASADGVRYGNTILINFDAQYLSIDKPNGFDDSKILAFRIYFQDVSEVWNFFEVKTVTDGPYSLCATYPEQMYRLQRRRCLRVDVPEGTRTVFWIGDIIHNGGYVKNISVAGMLICTGSSEEKFAENSIISDIAIALPLPMDKKGDEDEPGGRTLLPVMTWGRIVRSFRDEETNFICHGISFAGNSDVVEELEEYTRKVRDGQE